MSLDVKNIHLNILNIDEIGNDLALNSTHKLTLSSLAGINTNSKLILGNHTMSNLNSLNSQNNNSLFLEAFGTRSIILNHTTSTTNEVEIKSDGKTYFYSLPTITSTPSGDNQILSGRNFDLDYTSSFSPKVFAWNGIGTAVDFLMSTRTGFYIIVGKIVFFQATVVCTSKNSANAAWNVYLSLPETIVNASIPQSLVIGYINNLIGGVGTSICDLSISINFDGSDLTKTNLSYANLYRKTDNSSISQELLLVSDVVGTFTINYGGWYFLF